jgi:hypothetical protein
LDLHWRRNFTDQFAFGEILQQAFERCSQREFLDSVADIRVSAWRRLHNMTIHDTPPASRSRSGADEMFEPIYFSRCGFFRGHQGPVCRRELLSPST